MKKFDMIVVGDPLLVTIAVSLLKSWGIKKLAASLSSGETYSHILSLPCPWDNQTRTVQAHGRVFAKSYRQLFARGQILFKEFLEERKVEYVETPFFRVAQSNHEKLEMIAAKRMIEEDFSDQHLPLLSRKFESFDVQQESSAIVVEDLLSQISKRAHAPSNAISIGKIVNLQLEHSGVTIETDDHQKWESEFILLLDHRLIRRFFPSFQEVLLEVAEQYCETDSLSGVAKSFSSGVYIFRHGNEIFNIFEDEHVLAGGFRYLRKNQGVEPDSYALEPKVEQEQIKAMKNYFSCSQVKIRSSWVDRTCLPCDELPVVGPLFGRERAIFCTGFAQQTFPQFFPFIEAVADLVLSGKANIDPRFYPQRHRMSL